VRSTPRLVFGRGAIRMGAMTKSRVGLGILALAVCAAGALALLGAAGGPTWAAPEPAATLAGEGLPGRATPALLAAPTALPTPRVTSPFALPTPLPSHSPTPTRDCTTVFPLENVEAIVLGQTTLVQLQAAFGRAVRERGRASYFRFEAGGCVLRALIGVQEVLEVELRDYGTLGLLLAHYGAPAATGISQGNLTLRDIGHAVLLFPERGVIATFAAAPDALALDTPVATLVFRPPFDASKQLTRLNALPVTWQPPPLPSSTPGAVSPTASP